MAGAMEGLHGRSPGELSEHIVETARQLYIVLDDELNVAFANPVVFDQLGYRPDEVVGLAGLDFIHPQDVDIAAEALAQVMSESDGQLDPGVAITIRLRTKTGDYHSFEVGALSQLEEPRVRGTILHCQICDGAAALDSALRGIAQARPLEETLQHVAVATASSVSPAVAVVAWDWDGTQFHEALPAEVPEALRGLGRVGSATPWVEAMVRQDIVDVDVDAMPLELALAAKSEGFAACWTVPVHNEASNHNAALIIWRKVPGRATLTHRLELARIATVGSLTFRRHQDDLALSFAARHDRLTGIPNRMQFYERLDGLVHAGGGELNGVLYLDLDDFKPVNDEHGHGAGDEVLRVVSQRIRSHLRSDDLVARLGGDEFAVLCPAINTATELCRVADRLIAALSEPIAIGGAGSTTTVHIGVSVGAAAVVGNDLGALGGDAFLDQADQALREAKAAGKRVWRLAPTA